MVFCCITNCKNSSRTCNYINNGITFHRFPKDPDMRVKWISVTGKTDWYPTEYSRICSIHFQEEQFDPTTQRRTLIKTAIPSVNIWKLVSVPSTDELPLSPSTSHKRKFQQSDDSTDDDETAELTIELTEISADALQLMSSTELPQVTEPSTSDLNSAIEATEPVEIDTRGSKKLCAEVQKSRLLIASQRLKIKSLQKLVARYRKRILQLQELAHKSGNTTEEKGESIFFKHFLDEADDS